MAGQIFHSLISIMPKIKQVLNKFKDLDQRDLEVFIAEILGKDKSFVITNPQYNLSLLQYFKLLYFISQRKKGYSVAAIVGHKEFYNLDFFVNKHVLIPRPDTEIMVEEAIKIINHELETKNTNIIYVDVGTGSGCIPISIIKNLPKLTQTYAIDNSNLALKMARKNAKIHKVNIDFLHGNLLEPILKNQPSLGAPCFITITANLPYLTEAQFQNEPSIQREPKNALVADKQGLALYEELLKQARTLPDYCQLFLLLEIDPSQSETITNLILKYLPQSKTEVKKDLSGLDRLVIIQTPSF